MRPCKNRLCRGWLADCVPSHIEYCGMCQVALRDVGERVRAWLMGRTLLPEVIFFVSRHMDGCTIKELAVVTGLKLATVRACCEFGRIRARKIAGKAAGTWLIPATEIVRVCDIVFNWVTLSEAAKTLGVSQDTLRKDLKERRIRMPIYRDLSSYQLISRDRETLEQLGQVYRQIRDARRKHRGFRSLELAEGEIVPEEVAKLLHCRYKTVVVWLERGYLRARKERDRWIIAMPDCQEFLRRSVNREFPIIARHRRKFQRVLDNAVI